MATLITRNTRNGHTVTYKGHTVATLSHTGRPDELAVRFADTPNNSGRLWPTWHDMDAPSYAVAMQLVVAFVMVVDPTYRPA